MRRRGNKSHKVPNVKLRPAEKGAYAQAAEESCWAQDTQPEEEASFTHDPCPRPMKGFSICATGVQDKPLLFKKAVELGATWTPAFTDRVTHLIAEDHGGAKYMCALERKIPILKPSWILESYQIWLRGDDVDVEKSVEQHRLPIFSGVVVCPSGITDITRRTRISKFVTSHDGEYVKVLERPVRVTHLLCSGDEETDKMRYAEKFNARGEAKIHLVWEEWFWDSIDFGGRFDEATYQVTRPRPERKSLPAGPSSSSPPPTSDIPSEHDEIPSSSAGSRQPRPQPKDTDEGEDEPAFVNVLPVVTLQLWNSLLGRRGYEINDGEVILSPSKADPNTSGKTRQANPAQLPSSPVPERQFGAERSVITAFKRTKSFAPAVAGPSRQLPFRRTSTAMAVLGGNKASTSALPAAEAAPGDKVKDTATTTSKPGVSQKSASIESKIFLGMKFRLLGEAKCSNVREAIDELGGLMSTDEEEDVDFVIVRLFSGSKFYREEEDEQLRLKYRTECWLEQCIYENRICLPEEQVSSVPLDTSLPIPGAENIVLAISGFDQSQVCGLKRLFRALGVVFSTTFNKRCTHLLCPSGTGPKFDKSREWGIPVIGLDWLRAISRSGIIPQANEYLVLGSVEVPVIDVGDIMDVDVDPVPKQKEQKKQDKGKGKAVQVNTKGKQREMYADVGNRMDVDGDVEGRMQDITNDIPPEPKAAPAPAPAHKRPKPIPIERRATTILPTPEPLVPEQGISFGVPSDILGGPAISRRSSTMSSSRLSTPVRASRRREDLFDDADNDQNSDKSLGSGSNSSHSRPALLRNRKTMLNIDEECDQAQDQEDDQEQGGRVPSSKSPSPMKILKNQGSRSSLSPVKMDHMATKALQESITSLLGKRPSPESEEMPEMGGAGAGGSNGNNGGATRMAKRTRPQRITKAQSSESNISEPTPPPPPPPLQPVVAAPRRQKRTRSTRLSQTAAAYGGDAAAMNAFDQSQSTTTSTSTSNNKNANHRQKQAQRQDQQQQQQQQQFDDDESQTGGSSIRVMYEDPVQKEEKKRLLKLLKGDAESVSNVSSLSGSGSAGAGVGGGDGGRASPALSISTTTSGRAGAVTRRSSMRVAGF